MKSIISNAKRCYICGSDYALEKHHCIFGTANRKKADKDGLWVYLCHNDHQAVHNTDTEEKETLQKVAQKHWETINGGREKFIERYGRSYL